MQIGANLFGIERVNGADIVRWTVYEPKSLVDLAKPFLYLLFFLLLCLAASALLFHFHFIIFWQCPCFGSSSYDITASSLNI